MADSHMLQEVDQACHDCPIEQKHLQCQDKQLEEFEMPRKKKFEAFTVNLNSQNESSLQKAFLTFKKQKQIEIHNNKKMKKNKKKEMAALRRRFMEQAKKYYGVPYARKYWGPDTPEYKSRLFLDCCGLVRRVMHDLEDAFGFWLGPWNQAYMYDTLPITLHREEEMKPGDLVFMSGIYTNPKAKQQRHLMTHVEIWAGDGLKTIGSRWNNGKVSMWDHYKFSAKSFHSERYHFKSIDTWLRGICKSYCSQHKWKLKKFKPMKKSIFNIDDDLDQTEKQTSEVDVLCTEDIAADGQNITDSEDSDSEDYEEDAEIQNDSNSSNVQPDNQALTVDRSASDMNTSHMSEQITCEEQSAPDLASSRETMKTVSITFSIFDNEQDTGHSDQDFNNANCLKILESVTASEASVIPVVSQSHSESVITNTQHIMKSVDVAPSQDVEKMPLMDMLNDGSKLSMITGGPYTADSGGVVSIDKLATEKVVDNRKTALVSSSSQTKSGKLFDVYNKCILTNRRVYPSRSKTFVAKGNSSSPKKAASNQMPPGIIRRSKTVSDMKKLPIPSSKSSVDIPFIPFRVSCIKPRSYRHQAGSRLMSSACVEGKAFTRVKSKTVIPHVRSCVNFNRLAAIPANASLSSTNYSPVFPVKCHSAPQLIQHQYELTKIEESASDKNTDLCQHFHLLDLNCPDRLDPASDKNISSVINDQVTGLFPLDDKMKETPLLSDVNDCFSISEPCDGGTNNTEKNSQNLTGAD